MLTRLKAGAAARCGLARVISVACYAVLIAVLSACGGPAQATPTASAILAAATATLTPTLTATPSSTPTPTQTPTPTPLPTAHLLTPMVHEYQGWNNCGAVSAEMVLSYYGITRGQYEVAGIVRPYRDDKHVGTDELLAYLRSEGLEGRVCVNGDVERLQSFIAAGMPVMIRTILEPGQDIGHYVVLRGYDQAAHTLIANDSYFGPEHVISEAALEAIWAPFNHSYIPVYRPRQAAEVCRLLGEDCREDAMYERAAKAARLWTERSPDEAYAWYCLGDDLLALGEPEDALEAYAKAEATGLPPRTYWYRFGPFEARVAAERYEELLTTSKAVLDILPAIEELHLLRGQAYEGLGEPDKAVEEYQLAFEYHTNYAPAVAALKRLGADIPPTPTPTPFGTPNVPKAVTPPGVTITPPAGSQTPQPATATPAAEEQTPQPPPPESSPTPTAAS